MTADAAATVRTDRRAELTTAARHLLETEGAEALTIRLGAAVGIREPGPDVVCSRCCDRHQKDQELLVAQSPLLEPCVQRRRERSPRPLVHVRNP